MTLRLAPVSKVSQSKIAPKLAPLNITLIKVSQISSARIISVCLKLTSPKNDEELKKYSS